MTLGGPSTTLHLDGYVKDAIKSEDSTFNLLNENVATLNIGGQTSTINLGSASSSVVIEGLLEGALILAQVSVEGDASMNSNFSLGQNATIGGTLLVHQDVSMNSNINVSNNITTKTILIEEDATINGKTNIGSTLTVDSDASFNSQVDFNDVTVFHSDITTSANMYLTGDVSFNGNLNVQTINTSGKTTINDDIHITGSGTIDTDLNVGQNFVANNVTMNTINTTDNATFDKDVQINQNLTLLMDFIHNGNISQF